MASAIAPIAIDSRRNSTVRFSPGKCMPNATVPIIHRLITRHRMFPKKEKPGSRQAPLYTAPSSAAPAHRQGRAEKPVRRPIPNSSKKSTEKFSTITRSR